MLKIKNCTFSFETNTVIRNLTLSIDKSSVTALMGESGCGKSTLLKLIYGLYDCNQGELFWNKLQILGPKYHLIPGMEYMKYLAQDFDLMPFITVGENVGKFLSNIYPEEKQKRIIELLQTVEMLEYKNVKAKNLSGGQMQRVAIARVLAQEPEILLLDEPFSHIDNFRKNKLRRNLFRYIKEKGITTIIATHDINDVLSYSDEVVVIKNGEIFEQNNPLEIFNSPKNYYTASLFGEVNEIEINGKMQLIYPHQFYIVENSELKVQIINSYFKGSYYLIESKLNNDFVYFENSHAIESGTMIFLHYRVNFQGF